MTTPEETKAAISAANAELTATLDRTEDPAERTTALLVTYGRYAEIHAAAFVTDLFAAPDPRGHRNLEDLSEHAHVVVGELIDFMLKQNEERGLGHPEFKHATEQIAGRVFFRRLNELLSEAPARGSA